MQNIFRIKVGRRTKSGATEVLVDIVVQSESPRQVVQDAYARKYEGLHVFVEEVKDVKIEKKEHSFEVITDSIYANSSYSINIYKKYVDGYDELFEPVKHATELLKKRREEFSRQIADKMNLNYDAVKGFDVDDQRIVFNADHYSNLFKKP